jgi:spermidine synthase
VAQGSQRSFSYLYLSNVVGAILGTLIPTFFLVEILGFRGTLRLASSFNAFLAAAVLAVSLKSFPESEAAAAPVAMPQTPVRLYDLPSSGTFWLLLLTGVCSMAMEVVWIRLYTVYLGNVVYSFATILALYLGATYAGSQYYRRWIRKHEPGDSVKGWILLGLLSLLPLLSADPAVVHFPLRVMLAGRRFLLEPIIRAALGVAPFSAALGFLTPMLVDHYSGGDPDRAGRAYAVNVLGTSAGP